MHKRQSVLSDSFKTLVAIGIALVFAIIIIFCVSEQPFEAIQSLIIGPLLKLRSFGNVVELAIPLTFTALAFCIILKSKQFNLAVDGAFFGGGLAAAVIALNVPLPIVIHPIAAIMAGSLIGMIVCLIPAVLSVKFKANVLVTSLLLNYVIVFISVYILNYFLRDPNVSAMNSYKLPESAKLGSILEGTRIHGGLFIVILAVLAVYFYLHRSKAGYRLRMVGENESFAKYSGVGMGATVLLGQCIAGMIAGMGGAVEVLGMYNRFSWQTSPGYGWDGIVIAIMARNDPKMAPVFAFFLAYIRIGADIMSLKTDVQGEIVFIIQAVMIILVASSAFLSKWKHNKILRDTMLLENRGDK